MVVAIRQSKLPDPNEIGNSGSFFKNPVVSTEKAEELKERYPNMPSYLPKAEQNSLPVGSLINAAGKDIAKDAGVHKHQALVLVNYGQATGEEIHSLATSIMEDVYNRFGIQLEPSKPDIMPSVAFHTLGCKLNFAETSTIAKDFRNNGFEEVGFKEAADVYVINTARLPKMRTENVEISLGVPCGQIRMDSS